jgi:Domain of unknown function (DUF4399)
MNNTTRIAAGITTLISGSALLLAPLATSAQPPTTATTARAPTASCVHVSVWACPPALGVGDSNAGDDDEAGPTVAFTSLVDGASVAGGVELAMTADGVTIEEAGEVHGGAGHFHVVADAGCIPEGESIVRDADHVHFGGGQTDGVIYLEPGTHELCLQVGDGVHLALDITYQATVEVGITDRDQWCAVMGEVDDLFESTDTSEDDFAVRQVGYENIRRLVTQLEDGLDYVDPDVRDDLAAALDWATATTTAFINAEDEPQATATLDTILARYEAPGELPGTEWVDEHCESNISD